MKNRQNARFAFLGYMLLFTLGFEVGGYQAVLLEISQEFAMTGTQMGILASVQSAATILSTLLFGGLTDRMSKKKAVSLFGCLLIAGCILAALSGSALMIGASIFILGLGFSMVEGTTPAALSETDPEKSTLFSNMGQTFFSMGAVLSPLILQALMGAGMNWRGHFWISTALAALVVSLFYMTQQTLHPGVTEAKERERGGIRSVLCGAFFLVAGAMLLYVAVESGQLYFTKPYFIEELHDSGNAALSISFIWAAMIPSRLLASRVQKRKGIFVCICFAVAALACFLTAAVRVPGLALVWSALFGLAAGPIFPTAVSVCIDTFPGHTGRVSNLMLTAAGIGGVGANVAMGALGDAFGLGNAYYMVALLSAAGVVVFAWGYKKAKARQKKYRESM